VVVQRVADGHVAGRPVGGGSQSAVARSQVSPAPPATRTGEAGPQPAVAAPRRAVGKSRLSGVFIEAFEQRTEPAQLLQVRL
jgi:hypothetical protein